MYLARSGSPGSRTASAYSPGSARTWIGMARRLYRGFVDGMWPDETGTDRDPTLDQVLEFCARDPVERVFLEDVARRGFGRFLAVEDDDGALVALCHLGANLVPSGHGCGAFADAAAGGGVEDDHRRRAGGRRALGARRRRACPSRAPTGPGQPVYAIAEPPEPGEHAGCGRRRSTTSSCSSRSAPRRTRSSSASTRSSATPEGFRWRTRAQIADGRSWLWLEDGVDPLQGRGVGVDAGRGADPAGLGRPGGARPRLRRARDARPLPAAARGARPSSRSSSAPRTRPRSRSTSRSGCGSSAATARCSSDDARRRSSPGTARACSACAGV